MTGLRDLRLAAVAQTMFTPGDLESAVTRLGFVQADPIRAPARAQDLILRHRVVDYRAGDLERDYPRLPLVEEMLHVYGFLDRRLRPLLHPRRVRRTWHVEDAHPLLRRAILDYLRANGASHPRAIEQGLAARHPRAAIVNAWGGTSIATTRMLEVLHYRGLLHIVRREQGVRVYQLAEPVTSDRLSPQRRADGLIELLLGQYAPMPMATLMHVLYMFGDRALPRDAFRARVPLMLRRGRLRTTVVDGVAYVWLGDALAQPTSDEPSVRFLAPFDPIVWDRRRFGHLWEWEYRFEAYVPEPKRLLGYYALPILWASGGDAQVIGWVNAAGGTVAAGYARTRPRGRAFVQAFDAEVARLERFLGRPA